MKALLFDLDDTLYDERGYVESGFLAVARDLVAKHPAFVGEMPETLRAAMLATLDAEGRGAVFDRLLEAYGVAPEGDVVTNLVSHYRAHIPTIQLYEGAHDLLGALRADYRLALVTNGLPLMQRNKVAALALEPLFDIIIYCDELGAPKPATLGLETALDAMDMPSGKALMVGDNPLTDGLAAAALGIPFARVCSPRFAHVPDDANFRLESLEGLHDVLEGWRGMA